MKAKTITKKQSKPNFIYWIKENASSIWNLSINKMESFLLWPHLLFKGLEARSFTLNLWPILGLSRVMGPKIRTCLLFWLKFLLLFSLPWWDFNLSLAFIKFSYSSSSKTPKLSFPFIPYFLHSLGILNNFLLCTPSIDEIESTIGSIFCNIWLVGLWMRVFIQHASSLSSSSWLICWWLKLNTFSFNVILPKKSCITLFRQLIRPFAIVRKGFQRMIGTKVTSLHNGLVSSTTKSTE